MHRIRRILVPFLVSVILLVPLLQVLFVIGYSTTDGERFREVVRLLPWAQEYRTTISEFFTSGTWLSQFRPFHLWFLWYLLIFYAFVAVLFLLRLPDFSLMDSLVRRVVRSPWRACWLAMPTALMLYPMQSWKCGYSNILLTTATATRLLRLLFRVRMACCIVSVNSLKTAVEDGGRI